MLDEGYIREPRDLALCKAALNQSNAQGLSRAARHNILKPLSLWSEGSALHDLELCNPYLQTCFDTLHVLDGGITKKMIELAGNWLLKIGGWNEVLLWYTYHNLGTASSFLP
jgi:hypothetical protein